MWLCFYIEDKVGIIISSPHCHTENASKLCSNGAKAKKGDCVSIYVDGIRGVFIIVSISHCITENASKLCLKRGKNQEMWLCFYIKDKVGDLEYLTSLVHVFHTVILKMLSNYVQKRARNVAFRIVDKRVEYLSSLVSHFVNSVEY